MHFSTASLACLLSGASATIYYAGVAESGGEFGVWSATATPGTEQGNLFRIAFLLERMNPPATGLGATFKETQFDYFKQAVDYVTTTNLAIM
ncbi:hypothetical protein LQW54_007272 [Pestalotiopsis sp. IQ-011]